MNKQFIFALLASFATLADAQESPRVGLLYNSTETHSLTYRCEPVRGGQVTCEFVQTAVRLKATYAQLPAILENARRQFRSEKPPTPQECAMFSDLLGVLTGRKAAPKQEIVDAMTPVEKADAHRMATTGSEYCQRPTEENYIALARLGHERDRRTCSVSSHTYRQSFRPISEGGAAAVWVAQGSPEGVCGIVQLSRFEAEETRIGTSKFLNWKYIARKAITNPSAELSPGAKCGELDETPYVYDWRSKDWQMSCDYVQFSPL